MPTRVLEFHGYKPLSAESRRQASDRACPFILGGCKKKRSGGACSLQSPSSPPVIICPNRLYVDDFRVIRRIAKGVFGDDCDLVTELEAEKRRRGGCLNGREIVVFGQGFSGEVGIEAPSEDDAKGSFQIDFLLTKVNAELSPTEIVAIEVQTIDTTGKYSDASKCYYKGVEYEGKSGTGWTGAGFNWENVTKRILPQLIYKGHALRREKLAMHGLFFVVPEPVLKRIVTRVGGDLLHYPKGPGTVTFHSYQLGEEGDQQRDLVPVREFTTTVEQIAFAFVSPRNLPPLGTYETTLGERLKALRRKKKI